MDGENILDEEISAAVAVGANNVIEHCMVHRIMSPASLWSGLADGFDS